MYGQRKNPQNLNMLSRYYELYIRRMDANIPRKKQKKLIYINLGD
jgi:hypothetical protein